MPIETPANDHECLRRLHESIQQHRRQPEAQTLAAKLDYVEEVRRYIRGLPRRSTESIAIAP